MPITVKMLCDIIEKLAPVEFKEDWDNVGLLIGDYDAEIKSVMAALEITDAVIDEAIEKKVDLLITHHPLIFKPLNSLREDQPKARKIRNLIKANINYYAAHTNFDYALGGMGDLVSEKIGLKATQPYLIEERAGRQGALARIGDLAEVFRPSEFANYLAQIYKRDINYYDAGKEIQTVAVIGGAGMDFMDQIAKTKVDAFVTGDIKYHEVMESTDYGISIFDVGHYDSEIIFAEKIIEYLGLELDKKNLVLDLMVSEVESSPFSQARF